MKRMSIEVFVEWTPRSGNRQADQLANGTHAVFDPQKRVRVDLLWTEWDLLAQAFELGRDSGVQHQRNEKEGPDERLRLKGPW